MRTDAAQTPRPLAFGNAGRRLFGIFHPATAPVTVTGNVTAAAAARPGVLLCNAFGQEAIRSHRFLRVLAERLARQGHPVLRFDYYGTGDAMGDDSDADLDGWAADVLQADAELRRQAGAVPSSTWFGLRLGASLALAAAGRAAAEGAPAPARLVAWEPVVDGAAYLERLRRQHVRTLEAAFSLLPHPRPRDLAADPAAYRDEAIGFALPATLRAQLAALAWPASGAALAPDALVVVADGDDADGRAALQHARTCGAGAVELRHGVDWMRDTAENTPLVPAQALSALLQLISVPS